MSNFSNILELTEQVRELKNRLQKEFEFFAGSEKQNEVILKAKKSQINQVNFILSLIDAIFKELEENETELLKYMFISKKYGLNNFEIIQELTKPKQQIINEMKKTVLEGQLTIPLNFRNIGEIIQEIKPEVRTAEKPFFTIQKLKEMAAAAGPSLPKFNK